MKAGCQKYFKHRILADKSIKSNRISLSFRRTIPSTSDKSPNVPNVTPINNTNSSSSSEQKTKPEVQRKPAYTRVPKKTTVIFGTSITRRVIGKKLCNYGRNCINISKSGANIEDINDMIDEFYTTNPAANEIEKVIYSFGTNDIHILKVELTIFVGLYLI